MTAFLQGEVESLTLASVLDIPLWHRNHSCRVCIICFVSEAQSRTAVCSDSSEEHVRQLGTIIGNI